MIGVLVRRRETQRQTHMHRTATRWWARDERDGVCMPGDTKACQQPPGARRGKKGFSLTNSSGIFTLVVPGFQTSSLQNRGTINFCYFKPPNLWYFITAALENWHRTLKGFLNERKNKLPCVRSLNLGVWDAQASLILNNTRGNWINICKCLWRKHISHLF